MTVLTPLSVWGQIGINTDMPLGVFHVDPHSNNSTSLTTKYADDVIVDSSGNVGIGTVTPTAKLDVRGTVLIDDGSQSPGYLLTSDGTGKTQWRPKVSNRIGIWRIGSSTPFIFTTALKRLTGDTNMIYSGDQIGLTLSSNNSVIIPAGKYLVFFYGDIANAEYGSLYLKNSANVNLVGITYSEWLAGSATELLLSADTEVHFEYSHIQTNVAFYNGYNTSSYSAIYFMQLTLLQLR